MRRHWKLVVVFSFLSCCAAATNGSATVIISEIADKGTSSVCLDADWLELYNAGDEAIELGGYVLHDDNGPNSATRFTFPVQGTTNTTSEADASTDLLPGEYRLVCTQQKPAALYPQFGIGGDDTITLRNPAGIVVASVGPLPDIEERAFDVSFAWNKTDETYAYTSTPTPGAPNELTPITIETSQEIKARLTQQNDLGTRFFNMDTKGYSVLDAYAPVLDFRIQMNAGDYEFMLENRTFEEYRPFQSARILDGDAELLSLTSPGRIRPKGQSTLFMANCMGTLTFPFQLDIDYTNVSQTLFGVQRLYLRNHFSDGSFIREWSSHRMLARFGLPHLRARHVRVFINGINHGFYTLMEAYDQEYVLNRNFGSSFDPLSNDYAVFKVKTLSFGCGTYTDEEIARARARMGDTSTPPYAFERGTHRRKEPILGADAHYPCFQKFFESFSKDREDVILAYVRAGEDCASMLLEEGLVDRDIGSKSLDPIMEDFINDHLGSNYCLDADCSNSNLVSDVDVENLLKNFAVYAFTVNMDSPLNIGNNYYWATLGDGTGWKLLPYDHNTGGGALCAPQCDSKLVYWSIMRPTCKDLTESQLAGPLLSDPTLHAQYIEFVRSFVDTVMSNSSFIDQLTSQVAAIQEFVAEDFWSDGGEEQLLPDASKWNLPTNPWLPFLAARTAEVRSQLEAIDSGSFRRGPHLPVEVGPSETCVDWRTTDAPESPCFQGCQYDGCEKEGWFLPSWCDDETSICYHGDSDPQCVGIEDGTKYTGMEDIDNLPTACFGGLKVSECPAVSGGGVESQNSSCPRNCEYDGCLRKGWLVESFCDERKGICYHGDLDGNCSGIANGERYDQMENREGLPTVCWDVAGSPVRMLECPPFSIENSMEASGGAACLSPSWMLGATVVLLLFFGQASYQSAIY